LHSECTLHQLAPYIGKVKSSIAAQLVNKYTRPGDLVVDPFAGAGTIPLEAVLQGRNAFGADISPYARVLCQGKLKAPASLEAALSAAQKAMRDAKRRPAPDLRCVPPWVRRFFHPETLKEAIQFAEIARRSDNEFLMACFLGILHHQRPGFLSYPSSHLVPYLRDKKFPPSDYPEMYEYRSLESRLFAKIRRSYKRPLPPRRSHASFRQSPVDKVRLPSGFDALITSPPYMNALDYGRDNRLRLWFIDPAAVISVDNGATQRRTAFTATMTTLARKVQSGLRRGGHCVLVVGEAVQRSFDAHPSEVVISLMSTYAPSLRLKKVIADEIPDVRRARREGHAVKTEHVLVFRRA
jgi:hypothetical protein